MQSSAHSSASAGAPTPRRTLATSASERAYERQRGDADYTERIVREAASGDPRAWATLIDRYSDLLRSIARMHRLNSADTEDVVQTTWFRLIEHLPRITTPASVRTWLATTAQNESRRLLRQAGRCRPVDELPTNRTQHDAPELDARLLAAERDQALWQAVARLPSRDQTLVNLLIADPPLSYQEIADVMHMPIGSVGPIRGRCLSRLRRETQRMGIAA